MFCFLKLCYFVFYPYICFLEHNDGDRRKRERQRWGNTNEKIKRRYSNSLIFVIGIIEYYLLDKIRILLYIAMGLSAWVIISSTDLLLK